jgi:hypothetical protein
MMPMVAGQMAKKLGFVETFLGTVTKVPIAYLMAEVRLDESWSSLPEGRVLSVMILA